MRPGRSIPATGQPVGKEPQKGAPTVRVCTPQLHTRTGASFDFERHRSVVRSDDLRQPSARVQPSNTAMPSGGVTLRHAAWPRAGSCGRVHRSTTGLSAGMPLHASPLLDHRRAVAPGRAACSPGAPARWKSPERRQRMARPNQAGASPADPKRPARPLTSGFHETAAAPRHALGLLR